MNVTSCHRLARRCAKFWNAFEYPIVSEKRMSKGRRRGVALLLVMTYIAIMSATILSGFMNSQVSFTISANVRDDLKAYYKAKSALNLGRLMLTYQYELEQDELNRSVTMREKTLRIVEEKQAEIERLKGYPYAIQVEVSKKLESQIRSEAVKEFAERLKNKIKTECNPYGKPTFDYDTSLAIMRYIDNLVKEMVDNEGEI